MSNAQYRTPDTAPPREGETHSYPQLPIIFTPFAPAITNWLNKKLLDPIVHKHAKYDDSHQLTINPTSNEMAGNDDIPWLYTNTDNNNGCIILSVMPDVLIKNIFTNPDAESAVKQAVLAEVKRKYALKNTAQNLNNPWGFHTVPNADPSGGVHCTALEYIMAAMKVITPLPKFVIEQYIKLKQLIEKYKEAGVSFTFANLHIDSGGHASSALRPITSQGNEPETYVQDYAKTA